MKGRFENLRGYRQLWAWPTKGWHRATCLVTTYPLFQSEPSPLHHQRRTSSCEVKGIFVQDTVLREVTGQATDVRQGNRLVMTR